MKSMRSRQILCALVLVLASVGGAQGMRFETKGKVVTATGEADYPDHGRLKDAVAAGATVLVLKDIDGSLVDITNSLRRLISDLQLTTVIEGNCGGSCVSLFTAGKERYFAKPENKIAAAYFAGVVEEGSNRPAGDTHFYTELDAVLTDKMPRSLLNKYTTGWSGGSVLAISQPTTAYPEGALFDCPPQKSCALLNNGLTALNIGLITSTQLFDLTTQSLIAAPVAPSKASSDQR